ncbi:MAG: hypothetical protein CL472_06805 [Acidobacteria bacterium]|mgnify:CR=1 FL=1|nr:hypothetical protein [Acidobacteriota bacterium]
MPYSSLAVANTFIARHGKTHDITHMKVQKLLYFAYGWWLVKHNEQLLSEAPSMWRYGPIFEKLYKAYAAYGHAPLRAPVGILFSDPVTVPEEDHDTLTFIDQVFDFYRGYDEKELSSLASHIGSPWRDEAQANSFRVPPGSKIPDWRIRKHFARQL